ncbi:MAG: cysteine desulfurase NifS [Clostridia bacterium]
MRVYLDHAATTPCDKQVVEKMLPYFTDNFGNSHSQHGFGRVTEQAVSKARKDIADIIGCSPNELYFTASGTEADNWAIKGVALARKEKGNHIIISSIEHHAILNSADWLRHQGYEVTLLPVDNYGVVSLDSVRSAITDKTTLISVMLANNEVGTIEPIAEISKIAREHGIIMHTDCVQAMGVLDVNVAKLGVDLLTMSAHKFYGPKGIGALYIRNGVKIDKLIVGGGQERAQRGGTTNTPAIVGMAEALKLAVATREEDNRYVASLRDLFVKRVLSEIPFVKYNGHPTNRLPSNANFSFEFIEGESILMSMDLQGIAVSSGSACSSGSLDPSHVLLAMGIDVVLSHGSIRFSFGKHNTVEEVNYTVDTLKTVIEKLRIMSPLFNLKEGDKRYV